MANPIYKTELKKIDGTATNLKDYEGRVLLVVNVASKCGFTPQYERLEKLYERFRARGFEILAFPSNEFAAQEPGTNSEIAQFCEMKFGVKFPMFEKISVNGDQRHALFTQMIQAQPTRTTPPDSKFEGMLASHNLTPKSPTDIMWNFEKFLINRRGDVVARFSPDTEPDDPKIVRAIEANL
jgi:glutathione peroxidase